MWSRLAGMADGKSVGGMVRSIRSVTKGLSNGPGGKILDAVPGALDVALNAETRNEKAEGYGGVAGGLAGAWAGGQAGAMAGAALGSVVPVLGTAIGGVVGGAIGMAIGGLAGDSVGGWLGKTLFGEDEQVAEGKSAPGDVARSIAAAVPAPTAPVVAQALEQAKPKGEPPKVDQQFSYMPNMPITIQGDAKDPDQLFRSLESRIRSSWDSWSRETMGQQASTQLFDEAHV